MIGWEATAEAGQEFDEFPVYRDALMDRAVNELGLNRLRLSLITGAENPVDNFALFRSGQIDLDTWRKNRYVSVNDNDDPTSANLAGFHFSELDFRVQNVVLPMKQRLEANGERLYLSVVVVDFKLTSSPLDHKKQPEEYAELILEAFRHMERTYGFVPDAVEVVLEPDNANWSASQVASALVAAGNRLRDSGFTPDFVAPSTSGMSRALDYWAVIENTPGAGDFITEFSYHRYNGVTEESLQQIGQIGLSGTGTAMLEHIGSGYEDLHRDLKIGSNTSWQQFTLAFPINQDNGAQYYRIDLAGPTVIIGSRTKFLRQYFRYIRRGARRIRATSKKAAFDPLAFVNVDGGYVVVVKADQAGSFSVAGLPAGSYTMTYTTADAWKVTAGTVTLSGGSTLTTAIPNRGVLTIHRSQ